MPFYDYKCKSCNKVWESFHGTSVTSRDKACKFCKSDDIKILIHPVKGKRELTGYDLKESISAGAAKMVKEAENNENILANLVGEDKYNDNVIQAREDESDIINM